MKHSDKKYHNRTRLEKATGILLWIMPLLLIVPNTALDFTEDYTLPESTANILLPLGIYYLVCALWKKTGLTALLLFPLMFICAFQIVLLFLYGESIIGVDMFLNVATTNTKEVHEILGNLTVAIATVCLLYLPPLVAGILLTAKNIYTAPDTRRPAAAAGAALAAAGAICLAVAYAQPGGYSACRKLFPVNVFCNLRQAAGYCADTSNYHSTSHGFSFSASDTHPRGQQEIYVMIIGETSRADNWQINGYGRPTNPKLIRRDGIVSFTKALSESNTTHKSVPLMMSHLSAGSFRDSIYKTKGIIEAFREAGYRTAWISNQKRNHSIIDFFGAEAHSSCFISDDGLPHYDMELCGKLHDFIDRNRGRKCFVVLHSYGSHFNYLERIPENERYFPMSAACEASAENRASLLNAYDNTIRYTDSLIDSVIGIVESYGCPAAIAYASDHGEDIFDDTRGRFTHASPTPTYYQLHVPVLLWMSPSYRGAYPGHYETARANRHRNVSSSRSMFHTLLSLAGVKTRCLDSGAALSDTSYKEPGRLYLNDNDEAVPFSGAGLRPQDFAAFSRASISVK